MTTSTGSETSHGNLIHDDVDGEFTGLADKASPVSGDLLLLEDSAASGAKRKLEVGNLPAGTPGADSITNTELANMAQDTLKGRTTGAGTGDPVDLTKAQALAILNVTDGADPTSANETSHGDVVQDGDFGSNGYLKRTGAGSYDVQATPIPTADTAAKCTDAAADETSANETSHGPLEVDYGREPDGERGHSRILYRPGYYAHRYPGRNHRDVGRLVAIPRELESLGNESNRLEYDDVDDDGRRYYVVYRCDDTGR